MKSNSNAGVIYILTNPSFPEYVKIGYADDINKRLKELNRSECIPYAFRVYAVYEVGQRLQDIAIHNMIDNINPSLRAIDTFDGKKRKKEFYAMTADDAYAILRTIATISGTLDRLHRLTPNGQEILDEQIASEVEETIEYTEDIALEKANPDIRNLYQKLRKRLMEFEGMSVEVKKLYISFRAPKKITDIEIHKNAIKLFLNLKMGQLNDPEGITDDVSGIGHWGVGDYRLYCQDESELDYVIELVRQSYEINRTTN